MKQNWDCITKILTKVHFEWKSLGIWYELFLGRCYWKYLYAKVNLHFYVGTRYKVHLYFKMRFTSECEVKIVKAELVKRYRKVIGKKVRGEKIEFKSIPQLRHTSRMLRWYQTISSKFILYIWKYMAMCMENLKLVVICIVQ